MLETEKKAHIDAVFTENEQALIWAALLTYDVGQEPGSNKKLRRYLSELRIKLVNLFE